MNLLVLVFLSRNRRSVIVEDNTLVEVNACSCLFGNYNLEVVQTVCACNVCLDAEEQFTCSLRYRDDCRSLVPSSALQSVREGVGEFNPLDGILSDIYVEFLRVEVGVSLVEVFLAAEGDLVVCVLSLGLDALDLEHSFVAEEQVVHA